MASVQILPPAQLNFDHPEEWSRWIKRFDRYMVAASLSEKDDPTKINTLIYCMGEKAEDILTSMKLTTEQAKVYKTVKEGFDKYFVIRNNVIFERARFNTRFQMEGESVEDFITSLYTLVETCNYPADFLDEALRDRIVVGIRDKKLSQTLQLDSDLTLTKATEKVRLHESVVKQQALLRQMDINATGVQTQGQTAQADYVDSRKLGIRKKFDSQSKPYVCYRCGTKSPHSNRQDCPAIKAKCRKCKRVGHYEKICQSREVHIVEEKEEDFANYAFLGAVSTKNSDYWKIDICMDNVPIPFKIDTGADVTVISIQDYNKLEKPTPLKTPKKMLLGASGKQLKVMGEFSTSLRKDEKEINTSVYVVDKLRHPLLGRPAIEALELITLINEVTSLQAKDDIVKRFPKLFRGLGKIDGGYRIKLKPDAIPHAVRVPRRIAIPLLPKVKSKLEEMERQGVISKVSESTEWCAGIVVVPKQSGDIRICTDLTNLNKSVVRPRYQLPSVENTLAKLKGAKVFSKLDANSGFWQCTLSEESKLLTTFITPFGRYCYNRLPFGITSGPEFFQDKMSDILDGLPGVECQMDDMIVHGESTCDHYKHLEGVLNRLAEANVTLNEEKCEFAKEEITFVGHTVGKNGITPDLNKIKAVRDMQAPTNVTEVRRFLGMANQLARFSPQLANSTKPLRDLLSTKNEFVWNSDQEEAFQNIKEVISSPAVLALYDALKPTKISADSSSYGLGAVLLQQHGNEWRPVSYASRSLTPTEQNYAQVEKEALAVTWACERFADYLVGMHFDIETDHKPLVSLLGRKEFCDLPARITRFRLRLMRFNFTITHIPGKFMYTADALSRAPLETCGTFQEQQLEKDTILYVHQIVNNLPASDRRLNQVYSSQQEDEVCMAITHYCLNGWPQSHEIKGVLKPYATYASEFNVTNGILMKGCRIVIPSSIRLELLDKIHAGHQGIVKCRELAKSSIWWPGMSRQIEEMVKNCQVCIRHRPETVEPLIPSQFPSRPWEKMAADLMDIKGKVYLVGVCYYSRYIEVIPLYSTTSLSIINGLKSIYARHGLVDLLITDNGPQFSSAEFAKFARDWGFEHITSSPRYPQSNGEAERAVQTAKLLLKKNEDPYMALLMYRATPIRNGYSPAELSQNRKFRTPIPSMPHQLNSVPDAQAVQEREQVFREKAKLNFDVRHRVHSNSELQVGDQVLIRDKEVTGQVVEKACTPRSYMLSTPDGSSLRRNRKALSKVPDHENPVDKMDNGHSSDPPEQSSPISMIRRSNRIIKPPERLDL